ncbi:preprotein translocase subunit SecY [Ferruginibacter lapsinanis]|uniref:preprotein translocase subunit SecY n=1 Tax=Ferruginibacter lapsinanis TaxID=563172 RepID=UPI001E4D597F|nr:preprotein translocase subunit SecY [Ferruginibacter lapsinanis]UEG49964.1 preprotein translocase subunit SecY [Ferruginibacter lapsinanis]
MKKFIQTLKNIWSIEELRRKILFTLLLIFIYRVGSYIVLPGIDPNKLENLSNSAQSGMLGLLDAFVGGAFSKASILALGIMPYISASIFMQLMTILVPQMAKVQKEGESGRKKINQWTRYLTVIVTAFQAAAYIGYLKSPGNAEALITSYSSYFVISTVIILTVGTLFVMWLGEKITDKGLGNGTSIIIMMGILARLPQAFIQEWSSRAARGGGGLLIFLIEIAFLVAIIMGLIMLIQGTRRVPVNYAKQIVGNKQLGGARNFLPLKVNASGVMPIIFAQAILFLPTIFSGFTGGGWAKYFTDHTNLIYMIVYSVCVIGFTFLYTALIFNPKQMAEDLKRSNGFIPGVKPGQPTADYIGTIMDRITLPGAVLLAFVGILPGIFQLVFKTQQGFASFYGGTSLLIMVGVILDTLQQIETQLLMRQYDGLMSSGRVQGRQTQTVASGI